MARRHRIVLGEEEFFARSGQVLLDAAIESGVEIAHDCRAGRCGTCLTRVRRGITIGGASPDSHAVHACRAMVFSDLEIEAEDLPEVTTARATIEAVEDVGRDIVEVRLSTRRPMTFLPGQYGKFAFRSLPARPFSPTASLGSLRPDGLIRLNVKRVRGGLVTPHLGRTIGKGQSVKIEGPFGRAFFKPGERGRLVLIGGGTGFAPVWSIAAAALAENFARPIVLLASARSRGAFYVNPALRLAARYPNVTTIACIEDYREAGGAFRGGGPLRHLPQLMASDTVHAAGAPALVTAAGACADKVRAKFHADPFDCEPAPAGWLDKAKAWLGAAPASQPTR